MLSEHGKQFWGHWCCLLGNVDQNSKDTLFGQYKLQRIKGCHVEVQHGRRNSSRYLGSRSHQDCRDQGVYPPPPFLIWHSHLACRTTSSLKQACGNGSLALPIYTQQPLNWGCHIALWLSSHEKSRPHLQSNCQGQHLQGVYVHTQCLNALGECGMEIFPLAPTPGACEAGVTSDDAVWIGPESLRNQGYFIVKGEKCQPPIYDCLTSSEIIDSPCSGTLDGNWAVWPWTLYQAWRKWPQIAKRQGGFVSFFFLMLKFSTASTAIVCATPTACLAQPPAPSCLCR